MAQVEDVGGTFFQGMILLHEEPFGIVNLVLVNRAKTNPKRHPTQGPVASFALSRIILSGSPYFSEDILWKDALMIISVLLKYSRPWQVVLLGMIGVLIATLAANDGDTDAFVQLGSCYQQCDPDATCRHILADEDATDEEIDSLADDAEGYDGQFSYFIARDPAAAAPCIDVPAYRYQRILLPVLGRLLALGNEDIIPLAFVAVNLLALVLSTLLLEQLLVDMDRARWFALVYGLFFGVVVSVRLSTSEPVAYGLVVGAIWFEQRRQPLWTIALMTLAAFAKETTGIFVAGFMLYYLLEKRWRDLGLMGLIVGGTFGAWQLYLYDFLGESGVGSGGVGGTPFEIIPYNGMWRIWYDGSFAAFVLLGLLFIPSAVIPSVWGLWVTIKEFRARQYHLYTCLFFASVAIMPFVPFSTYREFLGIFRFIVGMVFMHVLYTGLRYPGRPLTYSTLWLVLLLFIPSVLE